MAEVSLYLDEDVRVLLAEVLRNRGYSVVHTLELDRTGKSDEEQLAYAVKHKMALFTHNIKDYVVLSISYEKQKRKHYGVILSPQIPFNDLLKRSLKFLSSDSQETIKKPVDLATRL